MEEIPNTVISQWHHVGRTSVQLFAAGKWSSCRRRCQTVSFKPDPVDVLSCEAELAAILEFARLEKLVHEDALVVFGIAKSRDESGDLALFLNCELKKFSVTQKRVHA